MIPIPDEQKKLLQECISTASGNFSLYFSRMTDWNEDRDKTKKKDDAVTILLNAGTKIITGASAVLEDIHKRQASYMFACCKKGGMCLEIRAVLESAYVSGLGSGHPTETGMILDRNTGLPYIPASSLKGVLRNACEDEELKLKYFGNESSAKKDDISVRGQLVILDAFPSKVPVLKEDVMTPHFGQYYEGTGSAPVDTNNPIPIKFISVKEGAEYVFRVIVMPLLQTEGNKQFDSDETEKIKQLVEIVLTENGVGAKTMVGYGIFKEIKDVTKEEEAKAKEREKEIERNKAEEAVKNMSPADRMKYDVENMNIETAAEVINKVLQSNDAERYIVEESLKKLSGLGIKENTNKKWKERIVKLKDKIKS
ncbi:MAG TPA: type III-B CRISPR module RAMP protein Cmr6 [Candidatus Goldiibacteriota bacterium]|nr:type III-B CRISPR module RAMP protein Cmr6 [Candidatus Goldiibacteriota bacterium]